MPSSSVPIHSLPFARQQRLREISGRQDARRLAAANFRDRPRPCPRRRSRHSTPAKAPGDRAARRRSFRPRPPSSAAGPDRGCRSRGRHRCRPARSLRTSATDGWNGASAWPSYTSTPAFSVPIRMRPVSTGRIAVIFRSRHPRRESAGTRARRTRASPSPQVPIHSSGARESPARPTASEVTAPEAAPRPRDIAPDRAACSDDAPSYSVSAGRSGDVQMSFENGRVVEYGRARRSIPGRRE